MTNFRVVCNRVDGREADVFQTNSGFAAVVIVELAQAGSFGEYTRVRTEILCDTHGWCEWDGVCVECVEDYYDERVPETDGPCAFVTQGQKGYCAGACEICEWAYSERPEPVEIDPDDLPF